MTCFCIGPAIVSVSDDYKIKVGRKTYQFDIHEIMGITVLTKSGRPWRKQPSFKHPLTKAILQWEKNGKVLVNGLCEWE